MASRRQVLATVPVLVAGCAGGDGTTATPEPTDRAATEATADGLTLSSPAFAAGDSIPARYTADGEDVSPPLAIANVPTDAESLALVVDDPDAPDGTFVHWIIWNLPARELTIEAGVAPENTVTALDGARQGTNDFGTVGYRGPAPPEGDGPHTYRFQLSALDANLSLVAGATRSGLAAAMSEHVLVEDTLRGEYER
jgi:Raf kinase inhibitor-like YbhB/YbcL family protein